MTINETVKWFNSIYDINKNDSQTKSDFGIRLTSDIKSIEQDSNVILLGYTTCDNLEIAQKLIDSMRKDGFDVGQTQKGNMSSPFFVYLYKKNLMGNYVRE